VELTWRIAEAGGWWTNGSWRRSLWSHCLAQCVMASVNASMSRRHLLCLLWLYCTMRLCLWCLPWLYCAIHLCNNVVAHTRACARVFFFIILFFIIFAPQSWKVLNLLIMSSVWQFTSPSSWKKDGLPCGCTSGFPIHHASCFCLPHHIESLHMLFLLVLMNHYETLLHCA
jgi:hypothetical protein